VAENSIPLEAFKTALAAGAATQLLAMFSEAPEIPLLAAAVAGGVDILRGKSVDQVLSGDETTILGSVARFIGVMSKSDTAVPAVKVKMDAFNAFEASMKANGITADFSVDPVSALASVDPVSALAEAAALPLLRSDGTPDPRDVGPDGSISQVVSDLAQVSAAFFESTSLVNVDRTISVVAKLRRLMVLSPATLLQARKVRASL
jgi:hypothetical protein